MTPNEILAREIVNYMKQGIGPHAWMTMLQRIKLTENELETAVKWAASEALQAKDKAMAELLEAYKAECDAALVAIVDYDEIPYDIEEPWEIARAARIKLEETHHEH